jgi:UDP-N-acetylmuramate dehydrogenase
MPAGHCQPQYRMKITERPSLKALNSFGVQAAAGLLIRLDNEEDVLSMPPFDPARDLLLGGGSNVLITSDVPGTVWLNRITGRSIVHTSSEHGWVDVGAGENWHDLVRWTLDHGLSGLENLSLIPGLAGAAPIQNIGAYGVELSSVLESVTAWDTLNACWTVLTARDCQLGYRDSRFKSGEPGRYLITSIRLRLNHIFQPRLSYAGLGDELRAMGIDRPSATDVSDAVIRLRRRKLPDPARLGNAGSFFKNPVVSADVASRLAGRYPGLAAWKMDDDKVKLSAAWLIEFCGFKGSRQGDAGVSENHALVLVNHGEATGTEIQSLAGSIQSGVLDEFGVKIETEPRLIRF